MNWMSRAEYRRQRAAQIANDVLEDGAAADTPKTTEEQARWLFDSVESLTLVHVFSSIDPDAGELQIADQKANDPSNNAEYNELREVLTRALDNLPGIEQRLIKLTYFEDKSVAEASAELGMSRSWGSRTHAKILKKLARILPAR
jgi:RNA polymerase sigma factor for flagellar operon FliA